MTTATADRGQEMQYGYIGPIVKYEKNDDGTIYVYGKAAGPDLDLDGQRMDPKWLKSAMPKWYEWGNVREQHGNIAAGVGVELTEDGDDWYLKAHIVDPVTVKKVITKVLKGFSGGIVNGRVIKSSLAPNGLINDGDLAEISLVDRPCNPTNTMSQVIAKSVGGGTLMPVDAPEVGDVDEDGAEVVAVIELAEVTPEVPEVVPAPEVQAEMTLSAYKSALATVEKALAGEYSSTVPFITKAAKPGDDAEHADIAAATAAIDQILDLIISEATQAKGGRFKELRDIEVLLSAARSLCHFVQCEQGEDMDDMADDYAGPSMEYAYKAAGAVTPLTDSQTSTVVDKVPEVPATVDGASTEDLITKAVTAAKAEIEQSHEAELIALRAQLDKALAVPLTGGPVTFKRVSPTSSAPILQLTEAHPEYWRKLAKSPAVAPEIARAYEAKAAVLEKGAST